MLKSLAYLSYAKYIDNISTECLYNDFGEIFTDIMHGFQPSTSIHRMRAFFLGAQVNRKNIKLVYLGAFLSKCILNLSTCKRSTSNNVAQIFFIKKIFHIHLNRL